LGGVLAFDFQSTQTSGFDNQISDQTYTQYANPTKFYITQVNTSSNDLKNNPEQWVSALYYYSITRLKFADIPYNFLLDENGQIYEGKKGGIGVNPELKNIDGAITIGYLSNNSILTTRAEQSLLTMIEDISKKWGIKEYVPVKLEISENEKSLTTVIPTEINNDFSQSVKEALENWKGYSNEDLEYKANIVSVENEPTLEIGKKLNVKVNIKNENDFPWFTDKNPIYISVKDNKESSFAVNGVWESFSKPVSISDKVVKPGEEIEVSFDLQAKVNPGEVTESYEVTKFVDQAFGSSLFEVKFEIVKGDNKLVEVYSPEYGFVNIRECPVYNCKIIDSVDEGSVFIEVSRNESGWVKIQYDEDTQGWVYVKYIKSI
jgi:SH3-like domain-containing protein